jgi:hypothetical protein
VAGAHLFARTDRDAYAAVAARVGRAVADQDAVRVHRLREFAMMLANFEQDEVGRGWPRPQTELVADCIALAASSDDLTDIPVEIGGICKRWRQAGQRER